VPAEQSERLAGSQDFTSPDALGKGVLLEEDEIFSMMNDFLQGTRNGGLGSLLSLPCLCVGIGEV
jgi:hypothetical protein